MKKYILPLMVSLSLALASPLVFAQSSDSNHQNGPRASYHNSSHKTSSRHHDRNRSHDRTTSGHFQRRYDRSYNRGYSQHQNRYHSQRYQRSIHNQRGYGTTRIIYTFPQHSNYRTYNGYYNRSYIPSRYNSPRYYQGNRYVYHSGRYFDKCSSNDQQLATAMGLILGGAIGNQVSNSNQGTVAGAIIGGVIASQISKNNTPRYACY